MNKFEIMPEELVTLLTDIYRDLADADLPDEVTAAARYHCAANDGGTLLVESTIDDGRVLTAAVTADGQISAKIEVIH